MKIDSIIYFIFQFISHNYLRMVLQLDMKPDILVLKIIRFLVASVILRVYGRE